MLPAVRENLQQPKLGPLHNPWYLCLDTKKTDDPYSGKETKQRLQPLLRGTFSGPPTPLKDIPKKNEGLVRLRAGRARNGG